MKLLQKILRKIYLWPAEKDIGDIKSYMAAIESGQFKDKVVFGLSDDKKDFYYVDPVDVPGSLFFGGMGSGKSVAMRFTVATHVASNSENTIYLFLDIEKGMTDYAYFFNGKKQDFSKNVAVTVNDDIKVVPLVEMIYEEYLKRKEIFSKIDANNVYSFDVKMKEVWQQGQEAVAKIDRQLGVLYSEQEEKVKSGELESNDFPGITRVMIAIEEFHSVPNNKYVKFHMNIDRDGTIANKLKKLMRAGRSYGFNFMFATQRATSEDVPTSLKQGLTTIMAFKVNNPGDATAVDLAHATDIGAEQRGRCAYEKGFMQFPYLDDNAMELLLKKYYKPLKAVNLLHNLTEYHKAFAGEGTAGMVKVKKIQDIISFHDQYDLRDITNRVLSEFNIETTDQTNTAFVADMVGKKGNLKYAVRLIRDTRNEGTKTELSDLLKGANSLGCDKIIIVCAEASPPHTINRLEPEMADKTIVLDRETLLKIGRVIDNKDTLTDNGEYNDLYLSLPLAEKTDLVEYTTKAIEYVKEEENNIEDVADEGEEIKEEVKEIENAIIIDYNSLKERGKSPLLYVASEDVKIINMPKERDEEFKKAKALFKETGELPNVKTELADELMSAFDDQFSEEEESLKDNIKKEKQEIDEEPSFENPFLSDEPKLEEKEEIEESSQEETVVNPEDKVDNELPEESINPLSVESPSSGKMKKIKKEVKENIKRKMDKADQPALNTESLNKIKERIRQELMGN